MRTTTIVGILAIVAAIAFGINRSRESALKQRGEPLLAVAGARQIALIDPATPIQFDPPGAGWFHHTFVLRRPMEVSQMEMIGKPALRCATDAGGSIFGRYTDIAIRELPMLHWSWLVERPIRSPLDERTMAGDDHAARLFLRFTDADDRDHAAEIIWSNRYFQPGDYKIILGFPHLIAQSGEQELGRWVSEEVDLRELFKTVSGREDDGRLTLMALFCDSDETLTSSIAYFGKIELRKPAPAR